MAQVSACQIELGQTWTRLSLNPDGALDLRWGGQELHSRARSLWSRPVVLNQGYPPLTPKGHLAIPGISSPAGQKLVVGEGCYWHQVGEGQGCC